MVDLKAGENMTGKFNNSNNRVCLAYCIITPIVLLIGGAVAIVKTGLYEAEFIIAILGHHRTTLSKLWSNYDDVKNGADLPNFVRKAH